MYKLLIIIVLTICYSVFPISKANLKFIKYPDFPKAHSTWGSIGYSTKTDKVIIGVTDHHSKIALYEFDCATQKMVLKKWVDKDAHLQDWEWQGKIHTRIEENINDGWMYFGTDGGEGREEYFADHPRGYSGGYFMKYNPETSELINLGHGLRYQSIKEIAVAPSLNRVYGIAYPASNLIYKDLNTKRVVDLGSVNKGHVVRLLITDKWGNVYTSDIRGHLVKYEAMSNSFLFSSKPLPHHKDIARYNLRSGIRSYAKIGETFYIITAWCHIFKFTPQKKGMGKIVDLGLIYDGKDVDIKTVLGSYAPNCAAGKNGKVYYWLGGHGRYLIKRKSVLIELDPATNIKRIVVDVNEKILYESTGSNIIDKNGNIYFAGRNNLGKTANDEGESGSSKPIFVIFNPEKELK